VLFVTHEEKPININDVADLNVDGNCTVFTQEIRRSLKSCGNHIVNWMLPAADGLIKPFEERSKNPFYGYKLEGNDDVLIEHFGVSYLGALDTIDGDPNNYVNLEGNTTVHHSLRSRIDSFTLSDVPTLLSHIGKLCDIETVFKLEELKKGTLNMLTKFSLLKDGDIPASMVGVGLGVLVGSQI